MKYESEIIIDLPRPKVLELFDNVDNAFIWMESLKEFNPISGEPGLEGSKSMMKFEIGKRKMEMVETIVKRNFPNEWHATCEMKGVYNLVENFFEQMGEDRTRWRSISEFNFKGFMALIAPFMKSTFKKQSMKYLKDFKAFAESEGQ